MMNLEELKYPIGQVEFPKQITENHIAKWIQVLEVFPNQVEEEIKGLLKSEMAYKYRPEGWNIQQIINHCIDSHMNSVLRFKLTLTENNPTIKPYQVALWAELSDTLNYDINEAIILLKSLHKRWVFLLKNMSSEDFKRTFIHPEGNEKLTLKENLCIYDWHCRHHLQHIKNAKKFRY